MWMGLKNVLFFILFTRGLNIALSIDSNRRASHTNIGVKELMNG